ncbi:MAG: hypothetical protein H5T44_04605 [Thermoplasmatales archaeon]|nr:hypothetical protein [Thermoplasmatales archaeon]
MIEEVAEDILLVLLVHNVENKEGWVGKDYLGIKVGEDIDDALSFLEENGFIEIKEGNHFRITKNGISYILDRV